MRKVREGFAGEVAWLRIYVCVCVHIYTYKFGFKKKCQYYNLKDFHLIYNFILLIFIYFNFILVNLKKT